MGWEIGDMIMTLLLMLRRDSQVDIPGLSTMLLSWTRATTGTSGARRVIIRFRTGRSGRTNCGAHGPRMMTDTTWRTCGFQVSNPSNLVDRSLPFPIHRRMNLRSGRWSRLESSGCLAWWLEVELGQRKQFKKTTCLPNPDGGRAWV